MENVGCQIFFYLFLKNPDPFGIRQLGACCLKLAACGLSLPGTSHSCARTPGSGPGGRV